MVSPNLPFLVLLLLAFSHTNIPVQSHEGGNIAAEISTEGIDFLKDLLVGKAESSLVPLGLSDIEKSVRIPLIGRVHMVLSDITIESIHFTSSAVETGSDGIIVNVSGATANLSMNWRYWYHARLIPISISDEGTATVEVEGMEIGFTLSLKTVEGSLNVSLLECGCYVNDVSINLDGGASWLYQGLVNAFQGKIGSAVEDAVSKKLNHIIVKLDSLLQSLPKDVTISDVASMNVTFVNDPGLSESSVDVEIDGLFFAKKKNELALSYSHHHGLLESSSSCQGASKMAKISVHENVLESASSVYFEANKMHWIVDKIPNEALLNTNGWRYIIPELYKVYPNCSMNLNVSVYSPPTIKVEKQQIRTTIPLDVVIDILDDEATIPVVCISMVIKSSVNAEISGNTVAGSLRLSNLTMHLKWSKIGDLHMNLLQAFISTLTRTVVLPAINLKLGNGFRIPSFHGYGLDMNAKVVLSDSWIVICSDVAQVKQFSAI